jgi:hypothetical protein
VAKPTGRGSKAGNPANPPNSPARPQQYEHTHHTAAGVEEGSDVTVMDLIFGQAADDQDEWSEANEA